MEDHTARGSGLAHIHYIVIYGGRPSTGLVPYDKAVAEYQFVTRLGDLYRQRPCLQEIK